MANDRYGYSRDENGRDYDGGFGASRDFGASSARDYGAAGAYDRDDQRDVRGGRSYRDSNRDRGDYSYGRDYGSRNYGREYGSRDAGAQEYGSRDYGSRDFGRANERYGNTGGRYGAEAGYAGSYWSDGHRTTDYGRDRDDDRGGRDERWRTQAGERSRGGREQGRGGRPEGYRPEDRGFMARAGDEVRSWFGDEDAERRREQDARYDERGASGRHDSDYHQWRNRQIADLDRDYHEYRQENATRFENEFGAWRTERQGQRSALSRVNEHMEVVGSDGAHVGTVDKVRGDRILLTKNDPDAGGHHHSIPSRWIETVDTKVTIRKTADEAKSHWRDEERAGALFGDQETAERASAGTGALGAGDASTTSGDRSTNLNRSFSGTY